MYTCADCGFEFDLARAEAAGPSIVDEIRDVSAILREGDPLALRARLDPDTWSVHEYGCHLRDVFLVQRERVLLARRADAPDIGTMGRDERVELDGYESQLTPDVARQLDDAASLFAHVLSLIEGDTWERTMIYSYPERMERSLRWVAVHTLHEARHHKRDIEAQLG
jgi:DinB superfamily